MNWWSYVIIIVAVQIFETHCIGLRPGTHWRQSRIRHGRFCRIRQSLPTVEKTFDIWATFLQQYSPAFDKVEHIQVWRHCRPRRAVKFDFVVWTGNKVETISLVTTEKIIMWGSLLLNKVARAGDGQLSTKERQARQSRKSTKSKVDKVKVDKVKVDKVKVDKVEFNFVDFRLCPPCRIRLCRQCNIPALKLLHLFHWLFVAYRLCVVSRKHKKNGCCRRLDKSHSLRGMSKTRKRSTLLLLTRVV